MADLILPAVQLSEFAWRNIAAALRERDDPHLLACADAIDWQLKRITDGFAAASGEVNFKVTATLRAGCEIAAE
jgi:hypothetical protein